MTTSHITALYLAAMEASASKPLPANAANRAAHWATWVPAITDEDLAKQIAYWTNSTHVGSAQRRFFSVLQAEAARRG